ncbi:MAG: carbohydrate porin [Sulfuricella sp.]|nr:carbohydrate porin [Sulfuricella sp.]
MKSAFLYPLVLFGLLSSPAGFGQSADYEDTAAKLQGTYIWQKKPAFNAAYSGQNSLSTDKEISYTATITAFLGFRPWAGGEFYFNPEVTQGVPFSSLTGTGGFTNGEVTRTAGTNPQAYRQRAFLRQTWNHGGGTEKVESDLNQMAGTVDKNRFVLTVGNFSTLDVFDDNAYAHDPRRQFMNWAHMTSVAYDYAADARGYGWGFAAEWFAGDWALRLGRMTGPMQPNMLPTDFKIFKHYGDQVEVEHNHEIQGLPGSVKLLAWRNRAVMARFQDALAYGNSVNWVPDPEYGKQYLFKVRNGEQIKYGFGVNTDQALTADLGVFFKAMWSDGQTETLAFTEVDRSMTAGVSLKGAAWGRAQDTVGLAVARNELSRERRAYLEAGGISFFIGDGALRYRPETSFEGYYSWNAMKGLWLTADYQRIHNPAYNADRGPVNVWSARLHSEF